MKRVLVTGASGLVGHHCLKPLLSRDFEVHALSLRPHVQSPQIGVIWHQADLLKASDRQKVLGDIAPTHLLHAAWDMTPGAYRDSPANTKWLAASVALFESAIEAGVKRILGLGTCAEYDLQHGWFREFETPLRPSVPYASAKEALGRSLLAMDISGRIASWARVYLSFGPGDRSTRLIPAAIRRLAAGQVFECSHGRQIREFVYAEDLGDALAAVLSSHVTGPINVGSGEPRTIRSVVMTIARELGREELVRFGAIPVSGLDAEPMLAGDAVRLREEVGWCPSIGIDEGIRRTIRWWQSEVAKSGMGNLT
jgi:UDP-glucuronate decarboxylase